MNHDRSHDWIHTKFEEIDSHLSKLESNAKPDSTTECEAEAARLLYLWLNGGEGFHNVPARIAALLRTERNQPLGGGQVWAVRDYQSHHEIDSEGEVLGIFTTYEKAVSFSEHIKSTRSKYCYARYWHIEVEGPFTINPE